MTNQQARPQRERVNYQALRESRADSRAVYVPPKPKPTGGRAYRPAPLLPGCRCRYRRDLTRAAEVLVLVSVRDGVATVRNADGREWTEPLAVLVGERNDE